MASKGVLINPVRPQFVPVAWATFCAFGILVALRNLFLYTFLGPAWQAGLFVLGLGIFSLISIEGWWFANQREFLVGKETLRVRRWLDVVLGRPGMKIEIREVREAGLVYDRGKKLELRVGDSRIQYWAAIWDPKAIGELISELERRGVATRAEWGPNSPTR